MAYNTTDFKGHINLHLVLKKRDLKANVRFISKFKLCLKVYKIYKFLFRALLSIMYIPTAKGYFSGCGGMELGIIQAGVDLIQSLDLDIEATDCMKLNSHYFSHVVINSDIKYIPVLEQPSTDIIVGREMICCNIIGF